MNFCKKCNYVLNITKKQLNEEEKNHYKIATVEAFLNYIDARNGRTKAIHIEDIVVENSAFADAFFHVIQAINTLEKK
jgi:alpha-N-acetylglucosamine transferase